jgi:hypothetical protein
LFAAIDGSIHFALQKHNLPEGELLQILLIVFHFVFSFQPNSAIGKHDHVVNRATPVPLDN